MTTPSLISVTIPVYNGAKHVAAAIESVFAQTYRPIELIVIDDGSTDETAQVVAGFEGVRYAYQPNAGTGAALNHGLSLATGDLFAFLDADDLWLPDKLALQTAAFARDPSLDLVFGYVEQFSDGAGSRRAATAPPAEGYFKGTMLVPRAVFYRVGLFDPQWRIGDFIEWYIRAQELGLKSEMLAAVVLRRRIHDTNLGIRERSLNKSYLQILQQMLKRRQTENP